jgi:hypothetical protein
VEFHECSLVGSEGGNEENSDDNSGDSSGYRTRNCDPAPSTMACLRCEPAQRHARKREQAETRIYDNYYPSGDANYGANCN